jgi:hypothetical protein
MVCQIGATARSRGVNGIRFSEALVAEGEVLFAKACELDLEGIESKRAGAFYRSGTSRDWPTTWLSSGRGCDQSLPQLRLAASQGGSLRLTSG